MIGALLKEQTRPLHDAVEEKLLSNKIMDKSFTLDDYRFVIQHNFNFLKHFEKPTFSNISAETAKKLELDKRLKFPFIKNDFIDLNLKETDQKIPVQIKNEAEALGILYVMEGATLGGNMIAKNLAKNPRFDEVNFHYFGCYGEKTGFFWKLFKEVLEEKATEENSEDFLNGAKTAYHFLLEH